MTTACPECDSGHTYERAEDWKCRGCGATFEEPVERDRLQAPTGPVYQALDRADPEDLPLT